MGIFSWLFNTGTKTEEPAAKPKREKTSSVRPHRSNASTRTTDTHSPSAAYLIAVHGDGGASAGASTPSSAPSCSPSSSYDGGGFGGGGFGGGDGGGACAPQML